MFLLRHQPSHRLSVYLRRVFKTSEQCQMCEAGMRAAISLCFPPFAQSHEQEPPPLSMCRGAIWMNSLRKQGWFSHYMCWHNNGEEINTARPLLLLKRRAGLKATGASSAWGGGHPGTKEPLKVCLSGLQMMKAESSVILSTRPGQALITQPRGSLLMMLMIIAIGKETGDLYWKVAMATHCDPFSANHGAGGTMVYVAHTAERLYSHASVQFLLTNQLCSKKVTL